MYISLVRPHLEYASQVWNTYKTGEINSLEGVQKFECVQSSGTAVIMIYCSCALYQHYSNADYTWTCVPCLK